MQGFKPRGFVVHQQREQKFADGGLVQRLKSLIGGDRKRQIDSAVDAAANPAPKPAPQQEQKVVVSSSDGKFDEKRVNANNPAGIGFADGGRVRPRGFVVGPGTETSDSIPARLSAGEYVLPADTVEAVGVDQLDALREATHKPVKGEGAKAARGFFVGGTPGGVKEEDKPNFFPGNSPDAGAQIYKQPDPVNADTVKVAAGQVADAVTNPQGGGRLVQGAGELFANRDALQQQARERVPQPIPQPAAQAPVAKPAVAAPPVQASVQENAAAPVAQPAAPSARAQYVADQNAKLAAANQQLRAATQAMNEKYKPANTSPTNTFPANQLAQPKTPASAEVQKPAGFSYQDNNQAVGMDIKDSWNKGNYGEAIGKTVAGTVGMFSTPIIDGGLAAWDGAKGFGRGLLGVESPPGNATPAKPSGTTPKQDATASTPTPATATLNSALEAQRRRDAINGTTDANAKANTNDAAAPPAPESQGREVLPGVYAHGRGQYSDQAGGVGFSPWFTGKPSAQNEAAAEALAARSQQESLGRLAAEQYRQEVAAAQAINAAGTQYAPNSGLQYQWMSDIRDPRNLALQRASVGSRIFSSKGEEMMANKARQARVAGVQAAIGSQMHDAQAAQTAALQSKNTLAGNLATEQMRQDGENQRSNRKLAIDQQRLGIEAGKAAQESTARGFDIRTAQRRENILQRYDAAKTDQERVQLQRQYPDVLPRSEPKNLDDNFMRRKVPVLDEQGRPTGVEQEEIVDLRTGRALGAQTAAMPKVGETRNGYRYKGGDPNVQANWQPV